MNEVIKSLFPILFAVSIHELGHIVIMRMLGVAVIEAKSRFWGITIAADFSKSSYAKELAVILSGSAVNLIFACLVQNNVNYACASAAYGIFNLLPAHFLDGGAALYLLLLIFGLSPDVSQRVCRALTLAVTVVLWIAAVYFALRGVSAALLVSVFFMMASCFYEKKH